MITLIGIAVGIGVLAGSSPRLTLSAPYVRLSWKPSANNGGAKVTGYQLYRSRLATGTLSAYRKLPPVTVYTDAVVTAGVTYRYRVSAVNRVGTSARSNLRAVTVP